MIPKYRADQYLGHLMDLSGFKSEGRIRDLAKNGYIPAWQLFVSKKTDELTRSERSAKRAFEESGGAEDRLNNYLL
jgi:hypothetical protein